MNYIFSMGLMLTLITSLSCYQHSKQYTLKIDSDIKYLVDTVKTPTNFVPHLMKLELLGTANDTFIWNGNKNPPGDVFFETKWREFYDMPPNVITYDRYKASEVQLEFRIYFKG